MNEKRVFSMDEVAAYCSRFGFIFQGSEIYGGLANTWDYGPLGVRMKNNIKDMWRYHFIQSRERSYEVDADILMNPAVWEASGHVSNFSDPLVDCRICRARHRADDLIAAYDPNANADAMTQEEMDRFIRTHRIPCPHCGNSDFTSVRQFNLMFSTQRGAAQDAASTVYLRPENAQGEYVNYLNVLRTMRAKLPFSIGQIGKAFRNEITPGNFIFRTIEFEQMEYQTFCRKGTDSETYEYFKAYGMDFFRSLGLPSEKLRFHEHEKLAHYAKAACDIEYAFPFGWGEINGTHNRTDFDLKRHQEMSHRSMEYLDVDTAEKYIPYIVESTYGLDRIVLAVLCENLYEETINGEDKRIVLSVKPELAPIKVSVYPLIKKRHSELAKEIHAELSRYFMTSYDETGSIGKRYRRGDAVGIPFAVTVDDDTVTKGSLTVRSRDSMEQEVIRRDEIIPFLIKNIKG